MFEIFEISAAPHFPEPLKISAREPENIVALLAMAAENQDVEFTLRNGEIFIAIKPD